MPGLVDFAEREEFDSVAVKAYLEERFSTLHPAEYGVVVLGCTHFGYFRPALRSFFAKETQIIDGNAGTIRQLARVMGLSMTAEPFASRIPGFRASSAGAASADDIPTGHLFSLRQKGAGAGDTGFLYPPVPSAGSDQLIRHFTWLPCSSLVMSSWLPISCLSSVTWEMIPISL